MSNAAFTSIKNCCCLLVVLLLSAQALLAQKKHVVSYDFMNLNKGYAPLHLQYERVMNPRFSLQGSVHYFRVTPLSLTPQSTTTSVTDAPFRTGDGFTDFIIFSFSKVLNGNKPAYGTMKAAYNQRGAMIGFGPRYYLSSPRHLYRPYLQADAQFYLYQCDLYHFTRSKSAPVLNGDRYTYDVTTSESITQGHQRSAVTARLDGGIQISVSKRITADLGWSLGFSRINKRAKGIQDDFQVANRLKGTPEVPIRAAVAGPFRMSVGYRF